MSYLIEKAYTNFRKQLFYKKLKFLFLFRIFSNILARKQYINLLEIPIIIINYNQLHYLQALIDKLLSNGHKKIVIIDNQSTYPPLIDYYKKIKEFNSITIELMEKNYGHTVFYKNTFLQEKYGKGFFVLTDADINFYPEMPADYMKKLMELLIKYHYRVSKVGFALNLEDIPDSYHLKENVKKWEARFWCKELEPNVFDAPIDTTFALYPPCYEVNNSALGNYNAIRLGGKYTIKHGGWYIDNDNPTDEQLFYRKTSNASSSWKVNDNGTLNNPNSMYINLYKKTID